MCKPCLQSALESRQARGSDYLRSLDKGIEKKLNTINVKMNAIPEESAKLRF